MALCKHDLEDGCADCGTAPPAATPSPADPRFFGPWFEAQFGGDCDGCGSDIAEGDYIRADGEGGWLCGICGHEGEEPAVQFGPVPPAARVLRDVQLVEWGPDLIGYAEQAEQAKPSLAAFLNQYREGS